MIIIKKFIAYFQSRKKSTKVFLVVLAAIIIIAAVCIIPFWIGAEKYAEDKYQNNDFKKIGIKLPYYENDAEIIGDWPVLYKPGKLIPFTVYLTDGEKEFTVIYSNGEYYDDYQLEDISRLCTEYFKKLTGNENIQNALFTDFNMPTENYYHYRTLRDLLKIDNRLWTENNITEFIEEYSQVWYSDIGIYVSDSFNDIPSLSAEAERLENIINNQFKDAFEQANSEVVHIYFTNQELNVERVSVIHEGVSSRFDYYGFLEEPKYCGRSKLQTDESIVFDEIIVCY